MPAIQLARLRQQTTQIALQIEHPASAISTIHEILDLYADRTHRPGQSGEPPPLIEAFNVPKPVLRQILRELEPEAKDKPEASLALCDALWEQPYLEFRLLASSLIGKIPPEIPEKIIERIFTWSKSSSDERLQNALFDDGLDLVIRDEPEYILEIVDDLLADEGLKQQKIGLSALLSIIHSPSFNNYPGLFRIINSLTRSSSSEVRPYVLRVITALAERTPNETAYFLRQNLVAPENPDTAWYIRQSLNAFPIEIQENLRLALRTA